MDFLQHDSFEASKELLVMYYLQRGRYVEGIRLNEAIKQDTMVGTLTIYINNYCVVLTHAQWLTAGYINRWTN